jgi:hypothetical protein
MALFHSKVLRGFSWARQFSSAFSEEAGNISQSLLKDLFATRDSVVKMCFAFGGTFLTANQLATMFQNSILAGSIGNRIGALENRVDALDRTIKQQGTEIQNRLGKLEDELGSLRSTLEKLAKNTAVE